MKSFRFENIWLLSRRDQRALVINFHPKKNLILGRNHTGKSSLIRSLFVTLGANPQGNLEHWDESTISVVEFSVDQQRYRALHHRGNRALFNEGGVLQVATGDHRVWSKHFAQVTGFNLILNNKESEILPADSSCFFLPFYINQDGSWQAGWQTFRGMHRYSAPWGDILDYFCGVRPPEYYEKQAKREQGQKALVELRKEQCFLERARERFGKSLELSGPKINADNFEQEIVRLTSEVTELNKRQESLRDKAVREQELLANIKLQVHLATDALRIYESDAKFLRDVEEDLICPTCGAEHSNSFLDLLTYAEDARILRDLASRLNEDARDANDKFRKTQLELKGIGKNYWRISQILDTRRGELQFRQVVDSLGAERAFAAFEEEGKLLKDDIDTRLSEIEALDSSLKKLTDAKRSKRILSRFREYFAAARHSLNLPPAEISKYRLASRPQLSGSGGPRSILAYYAALWRTCHGENAAFDVPVVIDSPNQQGQDDLNLPKVLKFIAQDLPAEMQLIVGLETETDYVFDRTVVLEEPYKLLQEKEFNEIEHLIEPMAKLMLDVLLKQDENSLFYE